MNYTLKEYTRDVVYNIQAICKEASVTFTGSIPGTVTIGEADAD